MRNHRCEGFTLVEILVALGITAVLTAILYGTFDAINRTSSALEEYSSRLRETVFFLDNLERELSGAFFTSKAKFSHFRISEKDLAGTVSSEISFTSFDESFLEISSFATDIVEVTYEPDLSEDGEALVLYKTVRLNPQVGSAEMEFRSPVLTDLSSFELRAIAESGAEKKSWKSEELMKLPSQIVVRLVFTDGYSVTRRIPVPLGGDAGEFINSGGRPEE